MKKIITVAIISILIAGIVIGVYLVQKTQIFKSKATLEGTRIEIVDANGNILTSTTARNITVKLIHAASQTTSPSPNISPSPSPTIRPTPTPRPPRVNMNVKGSIRFFNEDCLTPYNGSATLRVLTTAQLANGSWENTRGHNDLFYPTSHNVNQSPDICQKTEYHPYMDPGYQINADGIFAGCPPENMDQAGQETQDCGNQTCTDVCIQYVYDNDGNQTGECAQSRQECSACRTVRAGIDNDICKRDTDSAQVFPRCFSARSSHFEITSANPVLSLSSDRNTKRTFSVGAPADMQLKVIRICTANGCDFGQVQNPNNPNRGSTIKDFSSLSQGHVNYFANDLETASGNEKAWVYDVCVKSASATPAPVSTPPPSDISSPSPAVNVFPTHFRVANSEAGLATALEQIFDQNNKEIDWVLLEGNGQKTVYAQFKVNGVWESAVSTLVILNIPQQVSPSPISVASASASPAASVTISSSGKSADFNNDGKVNSFDVSLLFSKWGSRASGDLNIYDLNSDGVINSFDYVILKSRFRI